MKMLSKITSALFLFLAGSASFAFAAERAASDGSSLLLVLFVGFFALIVVFQLVPACLMFIGMVKGLTRQKEIGSNVKNSHV
ncbi:MAG: hypothetical protein JXQ81_08870 [Desulfuromonadales bacterium]|nr:hypothetical protein [Desulfuromonadales bacterium]